MPNYRSSRYSSQQSSEIRYSMMAAMQELATFTGIDIKTMQNTPPYSTVLNKVTSQKMASELKKLIDTGMVVKGVTRGKTVKYMLRDTYSKLIKDKGITNRSFGYGDYRDNQDEEEIEIELSERVCDRISLCATKNKYDEMW